MASDRRGRRRRHRRRKRWTMIRRWVDLGMQSIDIYPGRRIRERYKRHMAYLREIDDANGK